MGKRGEIISLEQRREDFWAKVERTNTCWLWHGIIQPNGYGYFTYNRKNYYAHRFVWLLTYGELPKLHVLHKCDIRNCVNPNHLFEGTAKDNLWDAMKKKRFSPRFLKSFTEEQAEEIKQKYKTGKYTHLQLAKEYGLSRPVVGKIINNKRSSFYETT